MSSEPGDFIFPFGKHKGLPLREIPVGYLDWALGLDNLRLDTRRAIEAYLKTQAEYDQDHWLDGADE